MTYPIYKGGYGYNAPHVLFQIGGIVKGYGIITSLTYDWQPEYPWIADKKSHNIRPIYTDVSLSIKVLANRFGQRPDADKIYFI